MLRRCQTGLTLLVVVVLLCSLVPPPPLIAQDAAAGLDPWLTPPPLDPPAVLPAPPDPVYLPAAIAPALPGLALDLAVTPDPVRLGETATVTLQVINRAPHPANNLVVTLPHPAAVAALDGPTTGDGWRWELGSLLGNQTLHLTATLRLMQVPPGAALLLRPAAIADGLAQPVQAVGGALVSATLTPSAALPHGGAITRFSPGSAAQLTSPDGQISVDIPSHATDRPVTLSLRTKANAADPPAIAGSRRGLGSFFLDALDFQGRAVHQFNAPLTITVRYTPEQLQARRLHENDLTIFWFDPAQVTTVADGKTQIGRWVPLVTHVDTAAQTAHLVVDHFSAFQLSDGTSPSAGFIPSLQGWQVSHFTGAANVSIPIAVPAGPARLTPNLALSYSSAATDGTGGARDRWQAGWVGKGWSFDPGGSISRNRSPAGESWDHFTLVFDGRSFDIVKGQLLPGYSNYADPDSTHWSWHSVDERFVRVRAVDTQTWQVWTKAGIRYDFSQPLWWGWNDTGVREPYKWLLTRVTDTHRNAIVYTYTIDTVGAAPNTYHPTAHLQSIAWGYTGPDATGTARYRAVFGVSSRWASPSEGVDTLWESSETQVGGATGTPHEAYRLNTITIESMAGTTYETVRRYELRYYDTNNSLQTDSWNGQKVLTLKEIWRKGANGETLPALSFTYGMERGTNQAPNPGWNRMLTMRNGQGGEAQLTYDHVWWPQQIPNGDSYYLYENYYRVTALLQRDSSAQSYSRSGLITYSYSTPALNDDRHAATVVFAQYPPSGNGDSRPFLAHAEKREFRGHSSVTAQVFDGDTTNAPLLRETQHWFYQGDAGCTPAVSTNRVVESDSCFQEMVRREAFRGRAYQIDTRGPGGVVLRRTSESFSRYALPFYGDDASVVDAATQSNNYKRAGLWRAFTPTTQQVATAYEGGSTPSSQTTNQIYDVAWNSNGNGTIYGNLSRIDLFDQSGTLQRSTKYWYAVHDAAYLVDRVWATAVFDSAGNHLSFTTRFYDGQAGGVMGTTGDLTRESAFVHVPRQPSIVNVTINSRDTSYGYDSFGNQTQLTTYAGAGWAIWNGSAWSFSPAGNGSAARTTTTIYDSTFHAFPIEVRNPLGQREFAGYDYRLGLLTSVTDPNGNTTSAGYDTFGRLTSLVKPGDSSAHPSWWAVYYDYERPLRYVTATREFAGQGYNRPTIQFYDGLGRLIQTKAETRDGDQHTVVDTRYDAFNRVVQESQPRTVTSASSFWDYVAPSGSDIRWTTTSFDALDRPIQVTAADTSVSYHKYGVVSDSNNPDYRMTFHDSIDAERHTTTYRYDSLGRLRTVVEWNGNCGFWELSCAGSYTTPWTVAATTTYTYDPLDQLIQVRDTLGNTTSISYDSRGRKTQMTDPDMGTWRYAYDAVGNLISQTDANNQTMSFSYDALDRLTAKSYGTTTHVYGYDENLGNGTGQRTSMSTWVNGVREVFQNWTHDERGRVVSTAQEVRALGTARTFTWIYDSADRLTRMTYPSGETVSYTYDAGWRQTSVCSSWGGCYVSAGAAATALNQPVEWVFNNGVRQRWSYHHNLARLTSLNVENNSGQSLFSRSYSYDAVGNLTTLGGSTSETFRYDDHNRLTTWTLGGTVQRYSYNAIGNLMSKAGSSYVYPAAGSPRPHTPTSVAGVSYSYDANGNLIGTDNGALDGMTGRRYSWNGENQLTLVETRSRSSGGSAPPDPDPCFGACPDATPLEVNGSTITVGTNGTTTYTALERYTYDGDGARVTRRSEASGQTTVFLGGKWEAIVGGAWKSYVTLNDTVVAVRDSAAGVTYLHGDHLGSVAVATPPSQAATVQAFDPWGQVRSGSITQTSRKYTGQYLDGTGLLYYNARYYDPVLGRFISADTVVPGSAAGGMDGVAVKPLTVAFHETPFLTKLNGENRRGFWFALSDQERQQVGSPWGPRNPQALNRYSYVLNNPLKYVDPSGHDPGERSANGYSYKHIRGEIGSTYTVDGYAYQVDRETKYLYRDSVDGRQYLMNVCKDGGVNCKYTDSASTQFGQFKTAVDNMDFNVKSMLIGATAGAVGGCVAGAAVGSVAGGAPALPGCLIGALAGGVVGAVAGTIFSNSYWSDEAKRAYRSMSSLGVPTRRRR